MSVKSPYSTGIRQIVHNFCKSAKHCVQYRPTQPGVGHLICGSCSGRSIAPHRRHAVCFNGNNVFKNGHIAHNFSFNVIFSTTSSPLKPNFRRNWRLANFKKLTLDLVVFFTEKSNLILLSFNNKNEKDTWLYDCTTKLPFVSLCQDNIDTWPLVLIVDRKVQRKLSASIKVL